MARALVLVAAAAAALAPAARRSHVSRREILGFGASAAIAVAAPPARAASGVARPRGNRLLREGSTIPPRVGRRAGPADDPNTHQTRAPYPSRAATPRRPRPAIAQVEVEDLKRGNGETPSASSTITLDFVGKLESFDGPSYYE